MAASTTRAALMPTSDSQLNVKSVQSSSRKRKHADQGHFDASNVTFTGKAVTAKQTPQTATFAPLVTLDRVGLPLAWLSPTVASAQLPLGYVFKTTKPCMQEKEHSILIARFQPNGGLYAIESVGNDVHTSWPLANWVSEELCHNSVKGVIAIPQIAQLVPTQGGHSRTASIISESPAILPTPVSPKKATNRRGAMARMSILTPKDQSQTSPFDEAGEAIGPLLESPLGIEDDRQGCVNMNESQAPQSFQSKASGSDEVSSNRTLQETNTQLPQPDRISTPPPPPAATSAPPAPLDPSQLHHQYVETLYLSKTSLAFWAKGPLSRTRAQCRTAGSSFGLSELKECYTTMILPTKKIDQKYKESIPDLIKGLIQRPQQGEATFKARKKRGSAKLKLGKDCLYSGETEHIEKWWSARDLKPGLDLEAAGEDSRKGISDLRNRETGMQLLLILEVLHLESLLSKASGCIVGSPGPEIKLESVENDLAAIAPKPVRVKKKRDLSSELDTMAERLSIWHTVGLGDVFPSPEKTREGSDTSSAKSKDKLREFCRDVVIPFYSAKLPDHAKSICRKLGGPNPSPQRPRAASLGGAMRPPSSASSKPKSRPTARHALERVLSEDQTARHGSPPTLSRSSTAPQVPSIKRESSETESRPMSRSGMQKSVSFSNREIDLVTEARVHDTKRRKLDKLSTQKKELEEAIDALKKPNRTSASRAFMDEVEKRNVEAKGLTKRLDKQIHITATPRRAKSRSISAYTLGTEHRAQVTALEARDPDPVIPSSTFKQCLPVPAASKTKRAVLSAIHDTPSRGLNRTSNPLALIEATPAIDRLRPDLSLDTPLPSRLTTNAGRPVLFTPVKRKDVNGAHALMFKDAPEIPEKAGKAMDRVMGGKGIDSGFAFDFCSAVAPRMLLTTTEPVTSDAVVSRESQQDIPPSISKAERSIYEQLGWDDDDM